MKLPANSAPVPAKLHAPICAALGQAVRSERLRRGFSQYRLAERARISRELLRQIEGGANTTFDRVWLICDALGISLKRLVARADDYL